MHIEPTNSEQSSCAARSHPEPGAAKSSQIQLVACHIQFRFRIRLFVILPHVGIDEWIFAPVFGSISGRDHSNFLFAERNQQELSVNHASCLPDASFI